MPVVEMFVVNQRPVIRSLLMEQVAQLTRRDCAVEWASYGQKWKTGTGRQYLRTL